MWKILNSSLLRDFQVISKRTYLSKAYNLNEEWAKRLSTPILQKVNVENLYYEIESKFSHHKKMSPVDVDIYANKIVDDKHMDEIGDLVQKLRKTEEATNVFDSTQHALIRNYIECSNFDSLVHLLDHRQEYGVFLDNFTVNLLLDKLIEAKNYKLGARFATIFALQEDFSNPITTQMSLYVCYKFLGNLEVFDDLFVPPVESDGKKKKEIEIKVRVFTLRNPHFDGHFDIKNTNHLLGKTFLYLADEEKNEVVSNSLKLLGYSLYEKYDKGIEFLAKSKSATFIKETVEIVKNLAEKVENLDDNETAKKFFTAVGNCWGGNAIYFTYDQQRVKDFRAIGVHKPYDIIQKFLVVKTIGKYKSRLNVSGVKMEIGDEIDELEAIIILDAAAYWVSIYHKISDHPINVRNGVPLKEWWIKMKVESFCQTGRQTDERIQKNYNADYMDSRDKCWWYINRKF